MCGRAIIHQLFRGLFAATLARTMSLGFPSRVLGLAIKDLLHRQAAEVDGASCGRGSRVPAGPRKSKTVMAGSEIKVVKGNTDSGGTSCRYL